MNSKEEQAQFQWRLAHEKQQLEKHGWIARAIPAGQYKESPNLVNYHTFGLASTYSHPDLQIVLDIDPQTVHAIFSQMANEILNGRRFAEGDMFELSNGYKTKLQMFREGGRDVLRLLFPDANHRYPDDKDCHPAFAEQVTKFSE